LQRLRELAQIFFLFYGLVSRKQAVVFEWFAADKVEGVSVPVVELIAAITDLFPPERE